MDLTRSEHIRIVQAVEDLSSKTCDILEGLSEQRIRTADTQDSINARSVNDFLVSEKVHGGMDWDNGRSLSTYS